MKEVKNLNDCLHLPFVGSEKESGYIGWVIWVALYFLFTDLIYIAISLLSMCLPRCILYYAYACPVMLNHRRQMGSHGGQCFHYCANDQNYFRIDQPIAL